MKNFGMIQEKRMFVAGFAALILLPNHDVFNWLFSGTLLVVWKQLLAVILFYFSIGVLSVTRSAYIGETTNIRFVFAVLIFSIAISVLMSLAQGLSLHRIVYAVLAYVGFVSASAFVVSFSRLNRILLVLRTASILGIISSVGLIVSYYTDWFEFLPMAGDIGLEEEMFHGYLRRSAFLFGASTTIYPFISFCIVTSVFMYIGGNAKKDKYYFVILVLLSPLAIFFTGSRSQLMLLFVLIASILLIIFKVISNRKTIVAIMLTIVLSNYTIPIMVENTNQITMLTERYQNSFDSDRSGNDGRYRNWRKGLDLFEGISLNTITGIGLGSSMGMVNDGRVSTSHYESSFFQAYSEAGYFGLIVRYFPGIYAILILLNTHYDKRQSMMKKILLIWFLVYMVSVFGSPTAGAYHTQFVYFFCVAVALNLGSFTFSTDHR